MKRVNDSQYVAIIARRLSVNTGDAEIAFLQFGRNYGQIANFLQHGGAL
ncbi:MAG: hypothetical protein Q8L11_01355 [Candidatus Moranbacteria bacterium]|nr:hypothetical protein [bacterium]MDP1833563.1 hypothetical protein [Candidatus Moranbacteria bacterium]